MKGRKRSKKLWKINRNLWLVDSLLIISILFTSFIFYALRLVLTELPAFAALHFDLILISMGFVGVLTFFIIIFLIIMHRSLEPIIQIEKVIDGVLEGKRSLRIKLRKKDLLHSLVKKLNRVLDLLGTNDRKLD